MVAGLWRAVARSLGECGLRAADHLPLWLGDCGAGCAGGGEWRLVQTRRAGCLTNCAGTFGHGGLRGAGQDRHPDRRPPGANPGRPGPADIARGGGHGARIAAPLGEGAGARLP